MKVSIIGLEISVILLGIALLLVDLWVPARYRKGLGYLAVLGLGVILVSSFSMNASEAHYAFGGMYVLDQLALFFKRFFLLTAIIVLLISIEFSGRIRTGLTEYFSLMLFGLAGMMFAASSHHFALLFVSAELITVTFYVLVSFQRREIPSLEAGVKYLVLSALSSGLLVYGIALVFGAAQTLDFQALSEKAGQLGNDPLFLVGMFFVVAGLGFKIAAFPFHVWAPDVYQGAPIPTTAFLAVGSKAAGFALLMRLFFSAVPDFVVQWDLLLLILAAVTILYGNLCALPQQNLKRLLSYSSIAHAGYLLMGIAALSQSGSSAVLYYLAGYLFAVLAAFAVVTVVSNQVGAEDIASLAGLNRRGPLLAAAMTLAMVSLTGIPPLAGFFGKFLLLKAVLEQGAATTAHTGYYWLAGAAIVGVVISIYYYFGIIRTIFWSKDPEDLSPIPVSLPLRATLCVCLFGMLYLGIFPDYPLDMATEAVRALTF